MIRYFLKSSQMLCLALQFWNKTHLHPCSSFTIKSRGKCLWIKNRSRRTLKIRLRKLNHITIYLSCQIIFRSLRNKLIMIWTVLLMKRGLDPSSNCLRRKTTKYVQTENWVECAQAFHWSQEGSSTWTQKLSNRWRKVSFNCLTKATTKISSIHITVKICLSIRKWRRRWR